MKKFFVFLLLCLGLACAAQAEPLYRTLREDCSGSDVLAMKQRLYALGYYQTNKLTDKYNDAVAEVVRDFQQQNGLPATGVADAYTQAVLFSEAAARLDGQRVNAQASLPAAGAGGDGRFRDLQEGDYGDDVLYFKVCFYRLKLYSKNDFNNQYNSALTQRVRQYQEKNGLRADGVLSPAVQEMLYAAYPTPTPRPTPTPAPTPSPSPSPTPEPTPLPLDAEGYLADPNAAPVVYESFSEGRWYYIGQDLQIDIRRYQDKKAVLIWYETEIYCKPGVTFNAILATGGRVDGHNFTDPMTLADRAHAVLAITDDNYGYRWYRRTVDRVLKYQQGVVIRDGEVRADAMPDGEYYDFPPLDVLAYYPDGRMELYYPEEHDAQDYLDMGVLHTLAFGPILLRDGEVNQRIYDSSKYVYTEYNVREPRQAIGYYGPGHYVIITAKGRADDSKGVVIEWMLEKMQEKGVSDAFNLDGGYTTTLYFMGQAVNKKANVNRDALREVSSMLSIGVAE